MDQIKEQIEILEDEINAELDLYRDRDDVIGASNHCFNRILEIDRDGAGTALTANMRRYLYAIHMLQLQMEAGHLKPHEMDQVVRIAETSLQLAGIKEGSRRGYLHEKIHHCKSNLLQQGGYPLGAQWELLIGKRFLSTDIIRIDSAISETMTLFHMGYAYEAGRGFRCV